MATGKYDQGNKLGKNVDNNLQVPDKFVASISYRIMIRVIFFKMPSSITL